MTFTESMLQTAAVVVGGFGPLALGFALFRIIFASINVWENNALRARIRVEEEAKEQLPILSRGVTRCPNPEYARITLVNRRGVETTLGFPLPPDLRWYPRLDPR